MKRIVLGALLAIVGMAGVANAQVYVGEGSDRPYYRHNHWRGAYAYDRDCRVIVRTHINRWGQRVMVRQRICD